VQSDVWKKLVSDVTNCYCRVIMMPSITQGGGALSNAVSAIRLSAHARIAQNGTFMAIVRAYYRTLIVNPPCRISNPLVSVTLWPPEVAETGYRFASFGTIPCYCFQFAHYGITSCCESQPPTHKLRCCNQTQSRKTRCWTLKYSTLLTKRCLILFSRLLNSVVNL